MQPFQREAIKNRIPLHNGVKSQTREQTSVPDLFVLTVVFLALKKKGFSEKKNSSQKKLNFFFPFFYATFQCGRYNVFNFFFFFFAHKKLKKSPQKVAYLVHLGVFKSLQP